MLNFRKILILVMVLLIPGFLAFGGGTKEAQEKPVLKIICFQGYAEPSWVEPFEEENNCEVKITYAGTIDDHFTKVKTAPEDYHIVSIDSGRVKLYYDAGLIQPVDTNKLTNFSKLGDFFQDNANDQLKGLSNEMFLIPFCWGPFVMTVNTNKIPESKLKPYLSSDKRSISYNILTAPEFKDQVAFFDEASNIAACCAVSLGLDEPYNLQGSDWEKVEEQMLAWKRNARTFTTGIDSDFSVLANEDAYIRLGGGDGQLTLKFDEAGIRDNFTHYPITEGVITWIDGWVITKSTSGASVDLAYKYIDYIISNEGQKQIAELTGFGLTNVGGSNGYSDIMLQSSPWFGESINEFPVPLQIMLSEEDYGRRVDLWNKIKATK